MGPVYILHFSDPHVLIPRSGWSWREWTSKHMTGWLNWKLTSRGKRFADALNRLQQIATLVNRLQPDGVVFSGDASAIGFGNEADAVANVMKSIQCPRIAVPGNHDHYTPMAVRAAGFENAFVDWQQGTRIGDSRYPFALQIKSAWFIGLNSARVNSLFWDAHGEVDEPQLERLDRLLKQLPDGFRILVTHYPFGKADGCAENRWHGLHHRYRLCEILIRHRVRAWICGHRHRPYVCAPTSAFPIALLCGGSSTQEGVASFSEIWFDDQQLKLRRWPFDPQANCFRPTEPVLMEFVGGSH